MKFYEALNIDLEKKEIISFVGAGGKTTALFKLAKELKEAEKRVLITTTTAIYTPTEDKYDLLVLTDKDNDTRFSTPKEYPSICVLGKTISKENKILGIDDWKILELSKGNIYDYILIEADGSRRKPIKAPAVYEPVIPSNTTKLIGVIGLDAYNREIGEEWVHRPQLFCQLTEGKIGGKIDINKILKLILDDNGLYKNLPQGCQKYLLLNKGDDSFRKNLAMKIFQALKKNQFPFGGMIVAAMIQEENYIKWSDAV
ncbi:probable selenium-dependent hydroxylase accessory protein YqeC [Natronincola peptidivorans]|uniref:Probable selenium-dependent hydroxylase accessory protein YqeC n=1 Tax=Natronincola peptidivorans TaxID=426128 RepID=A0A1I0EQG0_9FIRM|nr:selenium cofactor biosynthesis protein YqeC [Natronincola peptidivorans]SET47025.1 probable selenium-dependent hydroxylase accessory protein YqeC [Natronincola peptidivorans]